MEGEEKRAMTSRKNAGYDFENQISVFIGIVYTIS